MELQVVTVVQVQRGGMVTLVLVTVPEVMVELVAVEASKTVTSPVTVAAMAAVVVKGCTARVGMMDLDLTSAAGGAVVKREILADRDTMVEGAVMVSMVPMAQRLH